MLRHFFLSALLLISSVFAQNNTPFPTAPNKKGLQVQMVDDAVSLGIHHAGVNVAFGTLMSAKGNPDAVKFMHDGREYWFDEKQAKNLDAQIKPLSDERIMVYLILLACPTKDPVKDKVLLHPKAKADGKYNIAAFNTETEEGMRLYRAIVAFVAERYSGAGSKNGRAWGYIIGNEVNSQWLWYNLGKMPMADVCSEYEKAVRAAHQEITKYSTHARVYLSFDHHWNKSMHGVSNLEAYKGRDFLDTFAKIARERGDFEWHVAHHPYADDLRNPRTWLDKSAWPTDDSPHITFKNLEVACAYMRKPELLWKDKPRRIILSEQGINYQKTPDGDKLQAAGFAYAWEKLIRQDGIDAILWHRHVDHAHEGGLLLGLWGNKPGSICDPDQKRMIYDLFKKAGTSEWDKAAEFALPVTGLKSWNELTK